MTVTDFDATIRPQDDLFGYVNGAWLKTAEVPDDRSIYGSFDLLNDLSEERVKLIIEEASATEAPAGSEAHKVGDLYRSFMDEATIEAKGFTPIAEQLAQIDAVTTKDELVDLFGTLMLTSGASPVLPVVIPDRANPTRYLLHLYQGGIGLPDESYYTADEHAETREKYKACITQLLTMVGLSDSAETIYDLEATIAAAHWDRTANRDMMATYNLVTSEQLATTFPQSERFFAALGITAEQAAEICLFQPSFVEAISAIIADADLEAWKSWARWRVVSGNADSLTNELAEASFDFFGRTLTGAQTMKDRWKRGVGLIDGVLGEAVGKIYAERFFPAEAETAMGVLVENLLAAYRERISTLDWMAAETREKALAKVASFTTKIGKPVEWRDYSALEIRPDDLMGNIHRTNAFIFAFQLGRLGGPIDRDEWQLTPQTVNAYYNPMLNEIVFPAAILQPPFFDITLDPAYNYGAIGAVIGHEIGHGFDDQGSRFDFDGSMRDWWTEVDRAAFDVKVKALIEQYNGFSPRELDDTHTVNGALTVGENIGDLGGVAVAHHAYRLFLSEAEAPVIDGLTGDQRFFIGWALAWRIVSRQEESIRRLTIDVHSPAEFRVNVVRNVDAFHAAFDTQPGDGLWLDPADRVAIW